MSTHNVQTWRRGLALLLVPFYLALIFGSGAAGLVLAAKLAMQGGWLLAALAGAASPMLYVLVAGLLCLFHRNKVVEGRMPVDTGVASYFHRRLYGLCWTSVYYSGPVYYGILSVPFLKKMVFRMFGYRGSMDFTVYPDTWIRDLPLLDFGSGCYLANKATIGTNMIFIRNGAKVIEVGGIKIGAGTMIGHLSVVGPSTEIGKDVQIGATCGIGRRVRIGQGSIIGDAVVLDHGAKIGDCGLVRTRSYVGMGRHLDDGGEVPAGTTLLRERGTKASSLLEGSMLEMAPAMVR